MTSSSDFLASLDDLAIVRVSGEDAATFLHGQLSNDITGMSAADARLAAYCNPKGRMLGSLLVWRETPVADNAFLAMVKGDLLEPLIKRLRMFVLRSRVIIEPVPTRVFGFSRSTDTTSDAFPSRRQAWQVHREDTFTYISAPAHTAGHPRSWVIAPENTSETSLAERLGTPVYMASTWHAQDIEAGLGWVEAANVELFIPQSLNYDLIGGVSFTKGCYPGQEIVARAHYRGTVKRRGLPGACQTPDGVALKAGDDIFDSRRPGAPAGRIINAAACPAHGAPPDDPAALDWRLLIEVNVSDIDQAEFRVQSESGPEIHVLPLPYALEAKEE